MENNPQSNQERIQLNETQIEYISELASRIMYRYNFRIDEEIGIIGISCGVSSPAWYVKQAYSYYSRDSRWYLI